MPIHILYISTQIAIYILLRRPLSALPRCMGIGHFCQCRFDTSALGAAYVDVYGGTICSFSSSHSLEQMLGFIVAP